MRFALTGNDPIALCVARAVAAHPAHELVRFVESPEAAGAPPVAARGLRYCQSWGDLLTDPEVDAVIVGEEGEDGREALRQLVQAGKTVLFGPDLTQPIEFFYELALLEGQSPGRLFPLLALRAHPAVIALRETLARGDLGRPRHVRLERQIASAATPLLSGPVIERALLTDADLLRALFGGYDQVTAARSGNPAEGYDLAPVTLAGESGSAVLDGDPRAGRIALTMESSRETRCPDEAGDDSGAWLLEAFTRSIAESNPESRAKGLEGGDGEREPAGPSLWGELARSVELVEAVERSVKRRRTIDVHFESPSERGMFKTQMTAVGCSLLIFTLMGVVVYLIAAAAIPLPPLLKQLLVALIFLPLGVFLAAQLLLFVTRPSGR